MRKIFSYMLFSLSFMVVQSSQAADWSYIASLNNGTEVYARQTAGSNPYTLAFLYNNIPSKTNPGKFFSGVDITKANCKDGTIAMLALTIYSGPMQKGAVTFSQDASFPKYAYIIPGSIGEEKFNAICKSEVLF